MGLRHVRIFVGLAAGVALASTAVPAEAAEVRNSNMFGFPPGTNIRQASRVAPEGGSQCNGLSTAPTVETASGLGWGYATFAVRSGLTHPICITVEIQASCGGGGVTSASYNGAFDPSSPLANYLGHGGSGGPYSFGIDAAATFVVVVTEKIAGSGCVSVLEKITSDGPWADADERPRIEGSPTIGGTISGTDAAWHPNPSPTALERRWRRCDAAGAGCTDIPGATGPDYVVADADIGHTLRFRNIATDVDGTSASDSKFIEPFIPFEDHPNESFGAGDRVQNGAFAIAFASGGEDSHCDVPKPTPPIANQSSQFLFDPYPVSSLLNESVCLVVRTVPGCPTGVSPNIYMPAFAPESGIATNYAGNAGGPANQPGAAAVILPPAGTAEAVVNHGSHMGTCAQYAVTLGADAPFALTRPTVGGTAAEGGTLTAGDGAWSGTPAFTYSWLSCDAAGESCNPIDGATAATYTPTAADVGRRLRVRVTATQGRSVSSDSAPTAAVAAGPLVDRTPPTTKLSLARTTLQKVIKRGFIPVLVSCDEPAGVAVQANVRRKAGTSLGGKRIAKGHGACRAGRRGTIKVKLTRKARKGLKHRRSIALTLKATATDAAGNSGAVTKRASLKRRRRR